MAVVAAVGAAQPALTGRRPSTRWRYTAVISGLGLLLAAWVMGNPLVAAPDEPVQYVRAVGTAYGQWSGDVYLRPSSDMTLRDQLLAGFTRTFRIPARFALEGGHPNEPLGCVTFNQRPASCQYARPLPFMLAPVIPLPGIWDHQPLIASPGAGGPQASYVGTYHPFLYLPQGLAARAAGGATSGMRAARAVAALMCLVLLAGAFRCARSRAAGFGVLLAATPTTVFLAATITTNSLEITGSICFLAAGLAIVRGWRGREAWAWLTIGGSALALAKATGPLWLLVDGCLLALLLGRPAVVSLVRAQQARGLMAAAALVAATGLSAWWTVARMAHPPTGLAAARPFLRPAVHQLPALFDGAIGLFGWYDTPLPHPLYLLGRVLLTGTLVLALIVGDTRQRLLLAAAVLVAAVATAGITAGIQNPAGAVGQARHTLAVAAIVPMLCGHVLATRGQRLSRGTSRLLLGVGMTGVALLQFGAWYANSRRYAVGLPGPRDFLSHPAWSPPGGWWIWLGLALVGSVLMAAGGCLPAQGTGRSRVPAGTG